MERTRPPFPYFALWLLLLLGISLFTLLRYASNNLFAKEPPQITITAEEQILSWQSAKNTWNGSKYDREPIFILYGQSGLYPSQLTEGTEISVSMEGSLPDRVVLTEFALDADERSMFGSARQLSETDFYFLGKTGTFTLPEAGDSPIRGYRLTCSWGENICEYAIVVQLVPVS